MRGQYRAQACRHLLGEGLPQPVCGVLMGQRRPQEEKEQDVVLRCSLPGHEKGRARTVARSSPSAAKYDPRRPENRRAGAIGTTGCFARKVFHVAGPGRSLSAVWVVGPAGMRGDQRRIRTHRPHSAGAAG
ncbi:hypothetical protein GCM10009612_78410 [Streptomyces beijiangensis]